MAFKVFLNMFKNVGFKTTCHAGLVLKHNEHIIQRSKPSEVSAKKGDMLTELAIEWFLRYEETNQMQDH